MHKAERMLMLYDFFFFFFPNEFMYSLLVALGLHCGAQAFSSCGSYSLSCGTQASVDAQRQG